MFFDPRQHVSPAPLKHNPINTLIAPRPVGWIGTQSQDGSTNLAPFSYFNAFSADPPIVAFAPNSRNAQGEPKDTLANLRDTPEFTVSIVSIELAKQMNQTSADYSQGVSEFSESKLTPGTSRLVTPPHVGEAKAVLECKVFEIIALPKSGSGRQSHLVIGEVIGIYIDDTLIINGKIDSKALSQVARLGHHDYLSVNDTFEMLRPELD